MPPDRISRESLKYCFDIEQAAKGIQEFTTGKSLADYQANFLLQSGVERQFEIIGEAVSQLAKRDPATAERIPGYQRLIAFRNILIHGYADVDDVLVWGLIETHPPQLRAVVQELSAGSSRG